MVTSGQPVQQSLQRFGFIDSIRALGAGIVVLQHATEHRPGFLGDYVMPYGPGVIGIAMLFFVTGYVMPLSVGAKPDARVFLIRRAFRLWPLLIAAFLLTFAVGASGFLERFAFMGETSVWQWVANLLLINELVGQKAFLGVTWTLTVELVWYVLFITAVVRFKDRAADVLDIFVPASLVLLAITSILIDNRIPTGRPMGLYAAVIGFQAWRYHMGQIDKRHFVRSALVFAAVATVSTVIGFGYFEHPNMTLSQTIAPWALGALFFVWITLSDRVRNLPWVAGGWLPAIGVVSYSTYLLHPLCIAFADQYVPGLMRLPVAIGLTAIVSVIFYRLVEKPGVRWGRKAAGLVTGPSPATRTV